MTVFSRRTSLGLPGSRVRSLVRLPQQEPVAFHVVIRCLRLLLQPFDFLGGEAGNLSDIRDGKAFGLHATG